LPSRRHPKLIRRSFSFSAGSDRPPMPAAKLG